MVTLLLLILIRLPVFNARVRFSALNVMNIETTNAIITGVELCHSILSYREDLWLQVLWSFILSRISGWIFTHPFPGRDFFQQSAITNKSQSDINVHFMIWILGLLICCEINCKYCDFNLTFTSSYFNIVIFLFTWREISL